jgi:hypothetical protein
MKQYKNTVNTSTHITKTPTQLSKHPHSYTHPQYKIHTKYNSHNTIKCPQYKVKYPQYNLFFLSYLPTLWQML